MGPTISVILQPRLRTLLLHLYAKIFSTMQFLKSSVLLVLAFAMHASAQNCVGFNGICKYGTEKIGPCCLIDQTCIDGFVSTFFTDLE